MGKSEFSLLSGRLKESVSTWQSTDLVERVEILESLLRDFHEISAEWVDQSVNAKSAAGEDEKGVSAEEWLSGPLCIIRNLRLLRESLQKIRDEGPNSLIPKKAEEREGVHSFRLLPEDIHDRLQFPDFTADIRLRPEDRKELCVTTYRSNGDSPVGSCLVLGAGNVSSIPVCDFLYKLFVENRTVVLKPNPVLNYLSPLLKRAFSALLERKVLLVMEGGAQEGGELCRHPGLSDIHVTGSAATHEQILHQIRGSDKVLTSELGNISPVIVVPGDWDEKEFEFQAQNLVSMISNNSGFNCNALRMLVLPEAWPGSGRLLEAVRGRLSETPSRKAYYPGARKIWKRFLEFHPGAELYGQDDEERLPWTLIPDLDPEKSEEICFREEPFCSLFSFVQIAGSSPSSYLPRAVQFCNERLWGTLNATLIVDPETRQKHGDVLEAAISELRYGTVTLNHWAGLSFGMMCTPWGGYPESTLSDPQSGLGFVHNTRMIENIEKAVTTAPFYFDSTPPWFTGASGGAGMIARLAAMQARL